MSRIALSIVLSVCLLGVAGPASARAPRIEVAFALDATGSMGSHIADARRRIRAIADELRTGDPAPDVRFALVAFRDRGDEFVTRAHRFTGDIDAMQRYLDGTEADGGGDGPEAVLEGVAAAVNELAWSPRSVDAMRLLYVVGDAPPKHYPDTPSESEVARVARNKGIVIHALLCGLRGDGRESFARLARYTEGRHFDIDGAADPAAVARGAAPTSVSEAVASITRTYSKTVGVDFDRADKTEVRVATLATPTVARSGLLGRSVRWVRDLRSWNDVWAAHVSLLPRSERPPVPEVDFGDQLVLVAGGMRGGLEVERVEQSGGRRWARVRPTGTPGVRFLVLPKAGSGESDEGEEVAR